MKQCLIIRLKHTGVAVLKKVWTLVIVDCSETPAKGFISLIKDKSAESIMPLIEKHVRVGSKIFTDEAKVYEKLKKMPNLFTNQ
jgi:hypothetical protein